MNGHAKLDRPRTPEYAAASPYNSKDRPVPNPKEIDGEDLKLRELGFDPDAPAPEAVQKLRELRGKPGASDLAIARALGAIADPAAAAMLAEMEAGAGGALRREVRRSIYRLRQRGIEAPAAPAPKPAPAQKVSAPKPGLSALISSIDTEGTQMVWLLKARPQGGVMRLWGLVSETLGLLGVRTSTITRRELRAEREELERRAGARLVEVDPRLADFILCESYRNTPKSRRTQVGDFLAVRTEFTAAPPPVEFAHPIYTELASELGAEPSPELLEEPELAGFRFAPEELAPYVEEMNRARESLIVVSRASQEERMLAVLDRAVGELLAGERLVRLRSRLENGGYYMLKDGRRKAAGWAAAAAVRIRDGADLKQAAFFRALIRKELATVIAESAGQREAEPHLIVTPAEAIRAEQERAARIRRQR